MEIRGREMNPDNEFLNMSEYRGEGWKRDGHGILYQRDVLMLALWRATEEMKGEFRLGTELDEAGKFDDLCFSRSTKEERWDMRLVQIKHAHTSVERKITEEDLFDPRGQYFLPKYFISYQLIKEGTQRPSMYSTFWKNTIEDLIILTNRDLDERLKGNPVSSLDEDKLLFVDWPQRAAFYLPRQLDERLLKESNLISDYKNLICEIANAVSSGEPLSSSELVHSYALPIFNHCIVKNGDKGIYKFTSRESFSNNEFYDDLMREIAFRNWAKEEDSKSIYKEDGSVFDSDTNEFKSKFIVGTDSKTAQLRNDILNSIDCEKFTCDCSIRLSSSLVKEFDTKLKDFDINSEWVNIFMEALKSAKQDGPYLKVKVNAKIVRPLARTVIVAKHSRYLFSSKFIISEDISNNLTKLRDLLKREGVYPNLHRYIFDIEGEFTTSEDNALYQHLPKLHSIESVEEFRNKFKFYVNYPSEEKLKEILMKEINESKKSINFSNNYSDKILEWMTDPNISFYTKEKGKALFDKISQEELNKTLEIEKETHWSFSMNYHFKNEKLFDTNKSISIIYCPQFKLGCLKIFRNIIRLEHKYIFTSDSKLKDGEGNHYKQAVLDLFKTTCVYLVVECNQQLDKNIFKKITQILEENVNKRVIFLVKPNSTEIEQLALHSFKYKYHTNTSTVHIRDFTDESVNEVVKLNNVIFQGYTTSFKELWSVEQLNRSIVQELDTILSPNYIELLIFEKLHFGNVISTVDYDRNTYIDRTLFKKETGCKTKSRIHPFVTVMETLQEDELLNSTERILLVSSNAGMGKSTLLTNLALKSKDKYPQDWVVRLDLSKTCENLEKVNTEESTGTITDISGYIKECLGLSEFEEKIFDKMLELGKVRIYLDGVDEVSPDYFKLIIKILKGIKEHVDIKQVIVSTRDHFKEEIEKELNVQSYSLKSFTDDEQTTFLNNYLKKYFDEIQDGVKYVEKIKYTLQKIIPSDVLGIPLQTMMLASLFPLCQKNKTESAEDFLQREMITFNQEFKNDKFNLCLLYEKFITKKYDIFNNEKCGQVNNVTKRRFLMQGVSLEGIHTYYAIKKFIPHIFCTNLHSKINEEELYKVGLIVNISSVEFIHNTFAEFYTAKYIINKLNDENIKFTEFFISEVLVKDRYEHIRLFINKMLQARKLIEENKLIKATCHKMKTIRSYVKLLGVNIKHEILYNIIIKAVKLSKFNAKNIAKSLYQGLSLLQIAAREGSKKTVTTLLEMGADIDITNCHETPIFIASQNGHTDIVKVLLKKGADVNKATKYNFTPLNIACYEGHSEIVKVLLEKGADINLAANDNTTPLLNACFGGHTEIVKVLLEKGADIYKATKYEVKHFNIKNSEGLGFDINISDIINATLNNMTIYEGEKGADINITGLDNITPLYISSLMGHSEIVKVLLEKGADVNLATNDNTTPLLNACHEGHTEIAKVLLEKGADINISNNYNKTPLNIASQNGHTEIVKVLLEKGADINIADKNNRTPLNIASYIGHTEIVKVLLEQGADINIADIDNRTPLNIASYIGHTEIVEVLLEKGADINISNNNNTTPLNTASYQGHKEIVEVLLEKGADINIADNNNVTPLMNARTTGHNEIVKVLLAHLKRVSS